MEPIKRFASHPRTLLVAYGILIAAIGALVLAHTAQHSTQLLGARRDAIRDSISVLNRGGPPLLRSVGGRPIPAEAGDDPGIILYLSLLGHTIGTTDPIELLKWFYIGAFAVLLAVYPLLWFEVLSSVSAAVLSPIILLTQFRFLAIHDVYWISAWCLLLCLPALMLVYQHWGRVSLTLLVGIMLVASFASSIRAQAGLPIFFAAAIVVFLRERRWLPRIAFAAVLAVAYTAINGSAIQQIRHYRDASVGINFSEQYPSNHLLWHPAFLGLGFLPNNYGISWRDKVAIDAAQRVDPAVVYPSRDYDHTLRKLYFRFVRQHPGFALRVYLAKTTVVISDAFRKFPLAFLLLPAVLLFRTRMKDEMRLFSLLVVPAVVLGAVPPILAVPAPQYEFAWLGAWGFVWLLVTLWLVALIPWQRVGVAVGNAAYGMWINFRVRRRSRSPILRASIPQNTLRRAASFAKKDRAVRWSAAILIGVYALGVGLNRVARAEEAASFYQMTRTDLTRAPVRHGPTLREWIFERLPTGWLASGGVRMWTHARHLDVLTTGRKSGYQLISPIFKLHPGAYGILVAGEVRSGGLNLGVLDISKNRWVVPNRSYFARQRHSETNFHNGRMFTRFTLASDARMQLILSNWTPTTASSRWRLEFASLVRQTRPCGCSPPDSNAWISR